MLKNIDSTNKTHTEYDTAYMLCSDVFVKKTKDYGCAWRVLRLESLTDQILIKVMRIRSLQETGVNKVGDSIVDELIGIANYSIMAIIQCNSGHINHITEINEDCNDMLVQYAKTFNNVYELMLKKNHDYGEAWR